MHMAKFNSAKLKTPHARSGLEVQHKPHWLHSIADGVTLGLKYSVKDRPGVWYLRTIKNGKQTVLSLGEKDKPLAASILKDDADADGVRVLSFRQACAAADKQLFGEASATVVTLMTVDKAITRYFDKLETEGTNTRWAIGLRRAIKRRVPGLLARQVSSLTVTELQDLSVLFTKPTGGGKKMNPRTYDRNILKPLQAALNHSASERTLIWKKGLKTIGGAAKSRNVVLTDEQIDKLIATAWAHDAGMGMLIEALHCTGNRMSQVIRLQVKDFFDHPTDPYVRMYSSRKGGKTGQERAEKAEVQFRLEITKRLAALFRWACKGRKPTDYILRRSDGGAWAVLENACGLACHQMRKIVKAAELTHANGNVTLYALRHTSIVRQLKAQPYPVPVRLVAANHNTSVRMIEVHYSDDITEYACSLTRGALREGPAIGHNGGPPLDQAA